MELEYQIAYLSLGSNLGNREANLNHAVIQLGCDDLVRPKQISSYFETEPLGYRDQPWFLNIALELDTLLSPGELLDRCQEIERALGRVRTFPGAPRIVDLDILFYGGRIIRQENLTIPHPRMAERRFVLEPLAEIAPNFRHPVLEKTVRSLLAVCPDSSAVRVYGSGTLPPRNS